MTTGELRRVRRDLATSAALAIPGSGACMMAVAQAQAIDAELAARDDAALAGLEENWASSGYHAFGGGDTWSAVSSAGEILAAATADELAQKIRAHWKAMQ